MKTTSFENVIVFDKWLYSLLEVKVIRRPYNGSRKEEDTQMRVRRNNTNTKNDYNDVDDKNSYGDN